jgi:hypothetical protein
MSCVRRSARRGRVSIESHAGMAKLMSTMEKMTSLDRGPAYELCTGVAGFDAGPGHAPATGGRRNAIAYETPMTYMA